MYLPCITLFLPLIGCIISVVCIIFNEQKKAELFSSLIMILTAFLSVVSYLRIDSLKENFLIYNWINSNLLSIDLSILFDPLTAIMFLVVNIVSCLVHVFSIGYMSSDPKRARFFCYLSLFTFAMLVLVSSNNFIQLFLGWEGVGLCSYLLVGYYFNKPSANNAAIKAFLVNRVGDFGYLIAIALLYKYVGSLNFEEVFSNTNMLAESYLSILGMEFNTLTIITMFLFMAAIGKSAQLGLHVWLPDAMEGPTPVSALIHAATMVTAGVFLVARCSQLFEYSQFTLNFITYTGLITSVFAASIALFQDDIKKIIAYSTCSQLGYMFFACGISAYSLGIYHLVTHAFFKALLFLGAGSVIHACHHEQDIKKMGGLKKKLPYTYFFIIIGSLALAGIPPLAGFFSKDLILEYGFSIHTLNGNLVYIIGCSGAFMTAIYSTRLIYLTFHGNTKINKKYYSEIVESPKSMIIPLAFLTIGAIFSGYIFHDLVANNQFWKGSIFFSENINYVKEAHHIPYFFKKLPIILVVLAIFLTVLFYFKLRKKIKFNNSLKRVFNFFKNKWYIDEIYNYIIISKFYSISNYFWRFIDTLIIDGYGPIGVANKFWQLSDYFKKIQNGKIFSYAVVMFLGIIIFFTIFLANL